MQDGVAEDRGEFVFEWQGFRARDARVEVARDGARDLFGAGIDGDDAAAGGDEFLGERAVTAAEIENPLAGFRREQLDDARPEIGNEARGFS